MSEVISALRNNYEIQLCNHQMRIVPQVYNDYYQNKYYANAKIKMDLFSHVTNTNDEHEV